ncbi:hypothetical protein BDY17DRAFT_298779 [Neohortaea acidophila]|uniref:Uncharacterized protein n=1 Tax=Neohortaea acidophila TaxID=245834 RepID=A0A6A6PRS2_9PEZI|nr:uncharacterized protein BDY17DRAFT_298779 [Neohortaea acidophila]KAF2482595.1 hypothetical protein BDY17DRAFT_298779 [Neohortaea acidophila]
MSPEPTCTFLNIPSEIRVLIYRFLFNLDLWRIARLAGCYNDAAGSCDMNLYDAQIYTKRRWSPIAFANFTAILRTCRLSHAEAIDILYEQTLFNLRISDEQYNRTMRHYAPLTDCAFLPRIEHLRINPDLRSFDMLLHLPSLLDQVLARLTAAPAKIMVDIDVKSGSLSRLPPTMWPVEELVEDPEWEQLLREFARLRRRLTFRMQSFRVRNNVQHRLDQLVEATCG